MDTYEATKVVMSRIQNLDPENASKIMGYVLIQDQGDKEIIRLAFVPDSLLLSYISQAKASLGISPNAHFPQTSPRISIPNNGLHVSNPSPSHSSPSPSPRPFSYAAALSVSCNENTKDNGPAASSFDFYGGELAFLDDSVMSPSGRSDSMVFSYADEGSPHPLPHPFHRRSSSVNDAAFLSNMEEGSGFGWRPCMYFARGFCKNGSSCKFLHGGGDGGGVGPLSSPGRNGHGFDDFLRMKSLQQQRFAVMARGQQHFAYNKCLDFLNENPRNGFSSMGLGAGDNSSPRQIYSTSPADTTFKEEDVSIHFRNYLSPMGLGAGVNSSSRQIYLTFPADSTFKEDDVASYFSMFGPVQDVRIPFQQKRMFGFVTFLYPETVKLILAKGNPHFVCDSRVLVKPYKERGKVAEKKQNQQHHLDLGAIESSENVDLPYGSRMLLNTQEMMLRRKLKEDAELQHAIELQGRRMMNLQLMDLKNQHHNHNLMQGFRAGLPISSPKQSQFLMNQNFISALNANQENSEECDVRQEPAKSHNNVVGDDSNLPESFDHILPDNLFSSPTKSVDDSIPVEIVSSTNNTTPALPLSMASLKSCCVKMPRFPSGQEAIEM